MKNPTNENFDLLSGKTFPAYDPRTGEVIAHVAEGETEDINRAVSAARKAFDEGPWPKMTPYVLSLSESFSCRTSNSVSVCDIIISLLQYVQERCRILLRFADLVEKHSLELAALETWNNGKPFEQSAKSELPLFVRLFHYYAGMKEAKVKSITYLYVT